MNDMPIFLTADTEFDVRYEKLKEIILESNKITFLGGAGVSTGSGIPDFRSANGLYNNVPEEFKDYKPEFLLSHNCYVEKPKIFYSFYRKYMDVRPYEPNDVHKFLAFLEENGKMLGIATQNIDMLHEKAGSKKVYKVHGTIDSNHCSKCGKLFDINAVFDSNEEIPHCECGGQIKPDVVLYGEKIPMDAWNKAAETMEAADCLIVCGTSLKVFPAANLASMFYGKYLVVINRESTEYDSWSDVVFREDMNDVFGKLMNDSSLISKISNKA